MHTDNQAQIPQSTETTANKEQIAPSAKQGKLQSKNVRIHHRRTSVRLEPQMWNALNEIATIEGCSIHDLCSAVSDLRDPGASFTAALRVFLMEYYRTATKADQKVNQVQKRLTLNMQKQAEAPRPAAEKINIPQKNIA